MQNREVLHRKLAQSEPRCLAHGLIWLLQPLSLHPQAYLPSTQPWVVPEEPFELLHLIFRAVSCQCEAEPLGARKCAWNSSNETLVHDTTSMPCALYLFLETAIAAVLIPSPTCHGVDNPPRHFSTKRVMHASSLPRLLQSTH